MKYIYENVEQELLSFFNAIQSMPENWKNWCCLHAEIIAPDRIVNSDFVRANMMHAIEKSLEGEEGMVLFLGDTDVYIFACNVPWERLRETGTALSATIRRQTAGSMHYVIWDLTSNGVKAADFSNEGELNPANDAKETSETEGGVPVKGKHE